MDYRSAQFHIEIPGSWVDRTIYTYVGPAGKDAAPWIRVTVDADIVDGTVEAFAERGIRAATASAPGSRLLRRQVVPLRDGTRAVRAEIRWFPTDALRLYQRYFCVLWQKVGATAVSHLTKKTRATEGPIVDRAMESIRRRRPDAADPPPAEGLERHLADRFFLDLPAGWKDETVHMLAEPDESRFRRTLVARRVPLEVSVEVFETWLDGEIEALRSGIAGFELVDKKVVSARDGSAAGLLHFRRPTDAGARVAQRQLLAPRGPWLNVLNLTTEERPPREDEERLLSVLTSFRAEAEVRNAP